MFLTPSIVSLLLLGFATVSNGQVDEDQPEPLPGDLRTKGAVSKVANAIANILANDASGQNYTKGSIPATADEAENPACFPWYGISDQLTALFNSTDDTGCTDLARASIRMGFHDAAAWSLPLAKAGQDFGGADGSLYLFGEWLRPENAGLEQSILTIGELAQSNNVGVADMFQFAATHGVVTCSLGPRVRFFAGRKDADQPSPNNLLPSAFSDGDTLVNLFQDKTVSAHDLVALVGAHSTSKAFVTNTSCVGCSQDSTPGIWDVKFYNETQTPLTVEQSETMYQFPSDVNIMNQGQARSEWLLFVNGSTGAGQTAGDPQDHWNEDFSTAYIRLSLLAVNNINADVIECTDALPQGTGDKIAEPENGGDFNFHGGLQPPTNSTTVKRNKVKKRNGRTVRD